MPPAGQGGLCVFWGPHTNAVSLGDVTGDPTTWVPLTNVNTGPPLRGRLKNDPEQPRTVRGSPSMGAIDRATTGTPPPGGEVPPKGGRPPR